MKCGRKSQALALIRCDDGAIRFLKKSGWKVENDMGIDLFVYKGISTHDPNLPMWFVIEERSGLAVGRGTAKKYAIADAEERLSRISTDEFLRQVDRSCEKLGVSPLYRAVYL